MGTCSGGKRRRRGCRYTRLNQVTGTGRRLKRRERQSSSEAMETGTTAVDNSEAKLSDHGSEALLYVLSFLVKTSS
jgi:hypothetical protein